MVQSAPQCSLCFPGNPAEPTTSPRPPRWSLPASIWPAGAGQDNGQLRRDRSRRTVHNTSSNGALRWKRASATRPLWKSDISGAHGLHLQRAHLINNAPARSRAHRSAPAIQDVSASCPTGAPNRHYRSSTTFPVSTINLLENSAQSWYDAGYINVRRRYAAGFSFLANYTWSKNLTDAPDFRSPMFESSIPQNNGRSCRGKGTWHATSATDSRSAPSMIFRRLLAVSRVRALTRNWQVSTIYQAQTGFPFTISVFGDTANSGTVLGENPIRANYTGQPVFGPDSGNRRPVVQPGGVRHAASLHLWKCRGGTRSTDPACRLSTWHWSA